MNKQKFIFRIGTVSTVVFGLAFLASAQVSPSPTPTRSPMGEEVKELRQEAKQDIEQLRADYKARLEQLKTDLKAKIEAKQTELKNRLKNLKDERKKETVLRIDSKINELNSQMVDRYSEALNQLEDVLTKIGARADSDKEKGVDVSSVVTALDAAKKAITDARAAIEVQAGKTYKIDVTTEPKLKADVGKVRQTLHTDLKALEDKVKAARDSAHGAARALAKAHGRDLPIPSISPSVSPTVTP